MPSNFTRVSIISICSPPRIDAYSSHTDGGRLGAAAAASGLGVANTCCRRPLRRLGLVYVLPLQRNAGSGGTVGVHAASIRFTYSRASPALVESDLQLFSHTSYLGRMNVDLGGVLDCLDKVLLLLVAQAQVLDGIDGIEDRCGCNEGWFGRDEGIIGN